MGAESYKLHFDTTYGRNLFSNIHSMYVHSEIIFLLQVVVADSHAGLRLPT